jgi:hypothetical protein
MRMLKNTGDFFPAGLHPTLWSEERFCRLQKNCSNVVNYLV